MDYIYHILIIINIYIIIAVSTNLLVGLTKLLSLGQAAFYGIGAYLAAFGLIVLNLPLLPLVVFVMLCTAILSFSISLPSLRLKDDYFVLSTLGFQLIVFSLLYNWISVTKGPYGISGITAPVLFPGVEINGIIPFLITSMFFSSLTIFVFYKLIHSPFGRILKALRDDEIAVLSLGRNVAAFKIYAFVISSSFLSISGILYAAYVTYIDPTSFNLDESIFILSAVIIGGTGNIKGPVSGAIFVVLLPELLRFLGLPDTVAANLRQIIYGLIIIILMRFRPQGLLGVYKLK